ncbi:hypothetical protein [Streptomyces sp. NPDC001978]|uniref:hypothetical protein n=1 Tax=Streptomyces sp. NPDC001978 TaxID=3364627 RepID=UPI0036C0E075
MNTDELEHALYRAELRVLKIQAKLHRWAREDPHRRFDDLFNLVADPAFLLVAWDRVRSNKGARTAGVDGHTALSITAPHGVEVFLDSAPAENVIRAAQGVVGTTAAAAAPSAPSLQASPGDVTRHMSGVPVRAHSYSSTERSRLSRHAPSVGTPGPACTTHVQRLACLHVSVCVMAPLSSTAVMHRGGGSQ